MLQRFSGLERRAALLLTGVCLLACASDEPGFRTSQTDSGGTSAGGQSAGGGLSGSSGHSGATAGSGVTAGQGGAAGAGPSGQSGAGLAGIAGASGQASGGSASGGGASGGKAGGGAVGPGGAGGGGAGDGASGQGGGAAIDPLAPCQPGKPCLSVTYCDWYEALTPKMSLCGCGEKGVFECEGGLPTDPCEQGVNCQGPSSCHVFASLCSRSCVCEKGVFDCSEYCQPDVCKQGATCNLGSSCNGETDGCSTTCTCDDKGMYDCLVTCPSCPGPTTPACGDPCAMPGPPDACQCTYPNGFKAQCFCGERPGEEPRFLCCEGTASVGKSCAGYPLGYSCNGSSTICICGTDETWHCGWSD